MVVGGNSLIQTNQQRVDEVINSLLVLQRLSVDIIYVIDSRNAAMSANCVLEWIKYTLNEL